MPTEEILEQKAKRNRILKSLDVVIEYLKKGLTPEQIEESARNKQVIIPEWLMQKAIEKFEKQKNTDAIEK